MQIATHWCRVHGQRATAFFDGAGRYRCDALGPHGRRCCDTLLEPIRQPDIDGAFTPEYDARSREVPR